MYTAWRRAENKGSVSAAEGARHGFPEGWIVNPAVGVKADTYIPAYRKSSDGGVGDRIEQLQARHVPGDVEVDQDVWAYGPAQEPLVLAQDVTYGDELWIERAFLADPAYEVTVDECQDRATELDKVALAGLWKRKQAGYDAPDARLQRVLCRCAPPSTKSQLNRDSADRSSSTSRPTVMPNTPARPEAGPSPRPRRCTCRR